MCPFLGEWEVRSSIGEGGTSVVWFGNGGVDGVCVLGAALDRYLSSQCANLGSNVV